MGSDRLRSPGEAEEGVLALAQPTPVDSLEEDLIEKPTVHLAVVPPKLWGPEVGCRGGGRDGPSYPEQRMTAAVTMRRTI